MPREGENMLSGPRIDTKVLRPAAAAGAAPAASPSADKPARVPNFDLWPAEAPSEILEVLQSDDTVDRDVFIQNGFVHLVGIVPRDLQQRFVDSLRELGVSEQGFMEPFFQNGPRRMYLGMHFNARERRWEARRGDLDGAPVLEIPKDFRSMYADAIKRANRVVASSRNKKKGTPFPDGKDLIVGEFVQACFPDNVKEQAVPNSSRGKISKILKNGNIEVEWTTGQTTSIARGCVHRRDLAVVEFFSPSASMPMHQDRTESKGSIDAGYPVMGVCLGDDCDFTYSNEQLDGANAKKAKTITMKSGDVHLFGCESRLMWHGVSKIKPRNFTTSLRLVPGCILLFLRVL